MRGRKPKPTEQRRLEGNPGRRPFNVAEPHLPAFAVSIPEELIPFPVAVTEWQRLAPMLGRSRQVTEADRAALTALCLEWARYLVALAEVARAGMTISTRNGYPVPNPHLSIATRALAACQKLWPELGLTPSSRSRVKVAEGAVSPAGDDFSEFDSPPGALQ
jgi:P27 family predicted phage terminase small subunit